QAAADQVDGPGEPAGGHDGQREAYRVPCDDGHGGWRGGKSKRTAGPSDEVHSVRTTRRVVRDRDSSISVACRGGCKRDVDGATGCGREGGTLTVVSLGKVASDRNTADRQRSVSVAEHRHCLWGARSAQRLSGEGQACRSRGDAGAGRGLGDERIAVTVVAGLQRRHSREVGRTGLSRYVRVPARIDRDAVRDVGIAATQ